MRLPARGKCHAPVVLVLASDRATSEVVRFGKSGGVMKVVLFCGGLGLRLRDYAEHLPKPMVPIGYRPILWHVMKYFAHFGHRDFVLCLGYRGDLIKQFFLN